MKIKVGSNVGITLSNIPYSPIKVESTLSIEKEIGEDLTEEKLDSYIEETSKKVENFLYKDLESKMLEVSKKQVELKKRIKV